MCNLSARSNQGTACLCLFTAPERCSIAARGCRCDTGTMSLLRPSTRERQQGRIAMTVLQPAAGLLATNTADAAGPGRGDSQEQQQQQQVEPSTSRSSAGTDTWQQQVTGRSQTEQLQQQEQQQTVGRAAQKVSLKVRRFCWLALLLCNPGSLTPTNVGPAVPKRVCLLIISDAHAQTILPLALLPCTCRWCCRLNGRAPSSPLRTRSSARTAQAAGLC